MSRALIGALVPSCGVKQRSNIGSREFPDQAIDSLMARFNSLFSRNKFPVPQHRELFSKPLDSLLDFPSNSALRGLIELNSL